MSGLSPVVDCTLTTVLRQAGLGVMMFYRMLSTFWNEHRNSTYTCWYSTQQPLPKHPHVAQRWPRLPRLQVFLCIGVGYERQL